MFYLSKETQHQVDVAQMAYFPNDEVIEQTFLQECIQELAFEKQWIPERFHKAIDQENLHKSEQWADYLAWCEAIIAAHQTECETVYKNRLNIAAKFEPRAGEVFNDSLHDGEIVNISRKNDTVTLFLNMSGGFTSKALIQLTFKGVTESGELDQAYVYDELIETDTGYALRVLSGHPYKEWTIVFCEAAAQFVFRPKAYVEREQFTDVASYVEALTPEVGYYIVKEHDFTAIDVQQIEQRINGYYYGNTRLGKTVEQVIGRIYCDTYEDPYAHFSERVPLDALEEAALSDDPVLRVRAFNTMFTMDEQMAPIVNRVLRAILLEEHEEILIQIIAEHFDKLGLLDSDVKSRWLS